MRFQLKDPEGNPVLAGPHTHALYLGDRNPVPGDTFEMVDGTQYVVTAPPSTHKFRIGPGGLELRLDVPVRLVEKIQDEREDAERILVDVK